MFHSNPVIWSEGLLLSPHHFQQQDRYFDHLFKQYVMNYNPFSAGIIHCEIDAELLKIGKVAIISCAAVMGDGSYLNIPEIAEVPEPLDIKPGSSNLFIYLGMALKKGVGQESKQSSHIKTITVTDNTQAHNNEREIQIAVPHIKLLTDHDNRSGYVETCILKIKECKETEGVIIDDAFIPSCINIKASKKIQQFHQEIIAMLHHRKTLLAQQISNDEQTVKVDTGDLMLLNIINSHEAEMIHLSSMPICHPEKLFMAFLRLLGELTTYTSKLRYRDHYPLYKHENLQDTFLEVMSELRISLSVVVDQQLITIPIEERSKGLLVATINDKNLIEEANFILGVYSADLAKEKVMAELPQQIKIAPTEQIRNIINRALPGISLNPLQVLPPNLSFSPNTVYFFLDKQCDLWQELSYSTGFSIQLSRDFLNCKFECWALRKKS